MTICGSCSIFSCYLLSQHVTIINTACLGQQNSHFLSLHFVRSYKCGSVSQCSIGFHNGTCSQLCHFSQPCFIPVLYTATKFVIMIFDWHETFAQKVPSNRKLCKNIVFNISRNIFWRFVRFTSLMGL